jgi:hypothetical protein
MSLFLRLCRWVTDAFRRPLVAERVEDLPDDIQSGRVYLVGDEGTPWSAALVCPCGCKEVIRLSLIPDDSPRWRATIHDDGAVTLKPSVWRIKGCRSHFNLNQGRVLWTKDSPLTWRRQ